MEDFERIMQVFQTKKPKTLTEALKKTLSFRDDLISKLFDYWKSKQFPTKKGRKQILIFQERNPETPCKGTRGEVQRQINAKLQIFTRAKKTLKDLMDLKMSCQNQRAYHEFVATMTRQSLSIFQTKYQGIFFENDQIRAKMGKKVERYSKLVVKRSENGQKKVEISR